MARPHGVRIGSAHHHPHPVAIHPAARQGDFSVGLIGTDDQIGGCVRRLFQRQQAPVEQPFASTELRLVHLGVQVVLIEDVPNAAGAPQQPEQPIGVRWIASVQHLEAGVLSHSEAEPGCLHPGVGELDEEGELSFRRRRWRVGAYRHPVQHERARLVLASRTDHADPPACVLKGGSFRAHTTVQSKRHVLDDDQDRGPARTVGSLRHLADLLALPPPAPRTTGSPCALPCLSRGDRTALADVRGLPEATRRSTQTCPCDQR